MKAPPHEHANNQDIWNIINLKSGESDNYLLAFSASNCLLNSLLNFDHMTLNHPVYNTMFLSQEFSGPRYLLSWRKFFTCGRLLRYFFGNTEKWTLGIFLCIQYICMMVHVQQKLYISVWQEGIRHAEITFWIVWCAKLKYFNKI
jgi:hypothetical protein